MTTPASPEGDAREPTSRGHPAVPPRARPEPPETLISRGGSLAGPAIQTHGLTKRYGSRTVVDSLDIEVPAGVIAGFVGPNGAGKTTTLRMLLGLVRPAAGEGRVLGAALTEPAGYLPRVGAMVESPAFYPGLSGERNLAVQTTLAGLDLARIPVVLERVELGERGSDRYKTYSLGMKQRLGIAAALLGDPALLILDEPANGLDPAGIRQMRDMLRSLNDDGVTVFVSSQLLAEVQQVCDWLVVIDRGRRLFQGPVGELMAPASSVLVVGCQPAADLPRLEALLAGRGLPFARTGDRLSVDLAGMSDISQAAAEISRIAGAAQLTLTELTVTKPSLEDRYLDLISKGPAS